MAGTAFCSPNDHFALRRPFLIIKDYTANCRFEIYVSDIHNIHIQEKRGPTSGAGRCQPWILENRFGESTETPHVCPGSIDTPLSSISGVSTSKARDYGIGIGVNGAIVIIVGLILFFYCLIALFAACCCRSCCCIRKANPENCE